MERNNSLDKALKVLDLFISHKALSLTETVQLTGFSTSAAQRVLVTLAENGYLFRSKKDGLYRVATKIVLLNSGIDVKYQIVEVASTYMDKLSDELGFVVNLSCMDKNGAQIPLARSGSMKSVYLMPNLGSVGHPEVSASGKVMLSAMPNRDEIIKTLKYEKHTENSILSAKELLEEFENINRRGYAYDDEEMLKGLFCIASRLDLELGGFTFAISVSGYKPSMLEKHDVIVEKLKKTIKEIEDVLGDN